MKSSSVVIFLLWYVVALVQAYTGPDTWRPLLSSPERVFLPVFILMGYLCVWMLLGLCGRVAMGVLDRMHRRYTVDPEIFIKLFVILVSEGYWFSRNYLLPDMSLGSPVKLGTLFLVTAAGAVAARVIAGYAGNAMGCPARSERGGKAAAGIAVTVVFAIAAYYVFVTSAWSFHLFASGDRGTELSSGQNLVIVTMDTTGASRTSLHGFPVKNTPTLESLANKGVMFENMIAPMPVTAPSHSSIMTGMIPRVHGVINNDSPPLDEKFNTLAEILAERGWQTAQFVNFHMCSTPGGLHQGFDTAFHSLSSMAPFQNALRRTTLFGAALHFSDKLRPGILRTDPEEENYLLVKRWISEHGRPPFFLWFHTFIPHLPYEPPGYAVRELGYDFSRPFERGEIIASVLGGQASDTGKDFRTPRHVFRGDTARRPYGGADSD